MVIFKLFRRSIFLSNFRLLTGFSSLLSTPINRGNEARVLCKNQLISPAKYHWETRIDPYFRLLRRDDDLQEIKYFTALISGPRRAHQETFLRALATRPLITVILGVFKQRNITCTYARCAPTTAGHRVFSKLEEKRTDVNIAVHMLDDAYQDRCDRQILVSGDSDLVPPIRVIRSRFPNITVTVYVPARDPHRGAAVELRSAADKNRSLPLDLLPRAQFPRQVPDGAGGLIEKPDSW